MHKEKIGNTEFTFRMIDSSENLNEIFRLRYQVYCKECNFIKEEDYPEGIEQDKYDPYSLHFVAEDSQGIIGTARLVLDSNLKFPLEEHCNGTLHIDKQSLPRKNTAEISRLVICKALRRRRNDGLYYTPESNENDNASEKEQLFRRIRPMTFGLYREIYQESKRQGITHLLALMEKSLWILLRLHNFNFSPIGDEIDFYGPVRPYLNVIAQFEQEIRQKSPRLLEYFQEGLEPEYQPTLSP